MGFTFFCADLNIQIYRMAEFGLLECKNSFTF